MEFYEPRDAMDDIQKVESTGVSEIQAFYRNKCIFITGASGFVGTLVLEKLLRTCKDIKRVYVLFRSSRRQHIEERLTDYFNDNVFDIMKREHPNYYAKVICIQGDMTMDNLGLSPEDRQAIIDDTQVVFHIAATVRFDENLSDAYNINVKGTKSIIQLGKQMKHLESFVYVSTAYSNCDRKHIEEKFYEPVLNDEETVTLLKHTQRHEQFIMEPIIRARKPNSYIFTKSISEHIVQQNIHNLPLVVVRPSIVMPTLMEPMPYWLRNMNSFLSLVAGSGLGIIQVFNYSKTIKADFTPGDLTANCILAVGWEKATTPGSPQIYNCVGSESNVLVDEMVHETRRYYLESKEAVSKLVWKSHIVQTDNPYLLYCLYYILHVIPGLFFSLAELYLNRKPLIMKIYRKFFLFNSMVRYFACNDWLFANSNTKSLLARLTPRDRELFDFDMGSVSWLKFCSVLYRCVALYIIRDYAPYPKEVYKKKMRFIDPVDKAIVWSFKFLQFYFLLRVVRVICSFFNPNLFEYLSI